MLILVEGCDNTGKTTLARYLQRHLALGYHHLAAPEPHVPNLANSLSWAGPYADHPRGLVVDRCHWSAWSYGAAGYNPGNRLDADGFELVDAVFAALGGVVVHCTDTAGEITARESKDALAGGAGRDTTNVGFLDPERVADILQGMEEAELMSAMPAVRYTIGDGLAPAAVWVAQLAGVTDAKSRSMADGLMARASGGDK